MGRGEEGNLVGFGRAEYIVVIEYGSGVPPTSTIASFAKKGEPHVQSRLCLHFSVLGVPSTSSVGVSPVKFAGKKILF